MIALSTPAEKHEGEKESVLIAIKDNGFHRK